MTMKAKCPICTASKGRRDCLLNEGKLICSRCCAKLRSTETCMGCSHFEEVAKHLIKSDKIHTTIVVNSEIEEKADQGLRYLEKGNVSKAKKILTKLYKEHPEDHISIYGMGCLYVKTGREKEAIPYYKNAIEIFPFFLEAWFNLGLAYRNKNDFRNAVLCAQKVVKLGSVDRTEVLICKDLLLDIEKILWQSEGVSLEQFLEYSLLYEEAFSHMGAGEMKEAISSFHKVLAVCPSNHQSHGNLALCYAMLGQRDKALGHINKSLEIDPSYEVATSNRPAIENMKQGEPLNIPSQIVEYSISGLKPVR